MSAVFQARCLPVFVGSLPLKDHQEAADWAFRFSPQIPLWVQLPALEAEAMVAQFMPGLPGHRPHGASTSLDTDSDTLEQELVEFYEEYLALQSDELPADRSRFVLDQETAPGFFVLEERLRRAATPPVAVKGQITGPFTFATAIQDSQRRSIFYNDQLRDAAVKLLAMKAGWQVRRLAEHRRPVIIFIDEPALAGFGSSEYISISPEEVGRSLAEVIGAVQGAGGLAGVHVCANTEWSLVLDSGADILSFDAYDYFDKLVLYENALKRFIGSGGILAWGIVPTLDTEKLGRETVDSLFAAYMKQVRQLEELGVDSSRVFEQTLISTRCGAGSLSREDAARAMETTAQLSGRVRKEVFSKTGD